MGKVGYAARIRRFWRSWGRKITLYYNMEEVKVKYILT